MQVAFLRIFVHTVSASDKLWRPSSSYANNLYPIEAPQNMWSNTRSKLIDDQIIYGYQNIDLRK